MLPHRTQATKKDKTACFIPERIEVSQLCPSSRLALQQGHGKVGDKAPGSVPHARRSVWLRDCLWWAFLGLVLWCPANVGFGEPVRQQPLQLFSATEAQQLHLTEQEWHHVRRTRSAGAADGPTS
jgi:hypothetical protein